MKYGHLKTLQIDRTMKLAARTWKKMVDGVSNMMPEGITRRVDLNAVNTLSPKRVDGLPSWACTASEPEGPRQAGNGSLESKGIFENSPSCTIVSCLYPNRCGRYLSSHRSRCIKMIEHACDEAPRNT